MDRRSFLWTASAGLCAPVAACAVGHVPAAPELIVPYAPEREAALYPEGPPFLALYEHGGRMLGWVAAEHVVDPASSTGDVVREAFARVEPKAAVLEGFSTARGAVSVDRLREIAQRPTNEGSETTVALREAYVRGVEVWGGEPTDEELAAALVDQGFAPTDVLYATFFGPLEQDIRGGAFALVTDPGFETEFTKWADILGPAFGADPTPAGFRTWLVERYGQDIETNPQWFQHGWPGRPGVAGTIAVASNLARDRHAYAVTIERLNTHGRVVAVYGASHLSNVWDALARGLGPPRLLRRGQIASL